MNPDRFPPLKPETASALLQTVGGFEPDWLLILPYVPQAMRAASLADFAFASEVIAAPGKVSSTLLGQIRLQWWREALGEVFKGGAVRRHPVVEALAQTATGRPGAKERLLRIVDGVEAFLTFGEDHDLAAAIRSRQPLYGELSAGLASGAEAGMSGEVFILHALSRSEADADAAPGPEGNERPGRRFSRALAARPALEAELAARIEITRTSAREHDWSPDLLLLALIDGRTGRVRRIGQPLRQRFAVFRAALTGRP